MVVLPVFPHVDSRFPWRNPLPLLLSVVTNIPFVLLGSRQVGIMFAIETLRPGCSKGWALPLCCGCSGYHATNYSSWSPVSGFFHSEQDPTSAPFAEAACFGWHSITSSRHRAGNLECRLEMVIHGGRISSSFCHQPICSIFETPCILHSPISRPKTIDFVIHGLEEYTSVTIVSDRSEEIVEWLFIRWAEASPSKNNGWRTHGIKSPKWTAQYYTVITRLEINKLKGLIERNWSRHGDAQHQRQQRWNDQESPFTPRRPEKNRGMITHVIWLKDLDYFGRKCNLGGWKGVGAEMFSGVTVLYIFF